MKAEVILSEMVAIGKPDNYWSFTEIYKKEGKTLKVEIEIGNGHRYAKISLWNPQNGQWFYVYDIPRARLTSKFFSGWYISNVGVAPQKKDVITEFNELVWVGEAIAL